MYSEILHDVQRIAEQAGRDPKEILLLTVSKGRSVDQIKQAYNQGCRDFGESRVQEALPKMEQLPKDIRWHLIGTLQKNKVAKVKDKFVLIHSVDSPELAEKLSLFSTHILLQVNTSGEASKHGLSCEGWRQHIDEVAILANLRGLMTIAPLTNDETVIRQAFRSLRLFRDELVQLTGHPLPHLSMGMSHDYPIAIQEGATILRIGTAIFGADALKPRNGS